MGGQRKRGPKAGPQRASSNLPSLRVQVDTVRDLLARYTTKFEAVLPRMLPASRMIEVTMTEIARNPQLLKCTQASLIGCVIQCAQLGLQPGIIGEAYLIPFRNNKRNVSECTLVVGYKGLLKLAFNTGEVRAIECSVVHLRDEFRYEMGTDETAGYRHVRAQPQLPRMPDDSASKEEWGAYEKVVEAAWDNFSPGPITHVYASVTMKAGGEKTWEVMDRAKVMRAKKSSRAAESGQSPWQTHPDEMWMKTVLRHVCKRLPAATDRLGDAVALDERAEAGVAQQLGALVPELDASASTAAEAERAEDENGDTAEDQSSSADQPGGGDQKEQA